jgi:hypothetical protein
VFRTAAAEMAGLMPVSWSMSSISLGTVAQPVRLFSHHFFVFLAPPCLLRFDTEVNAEGSMANTLFIYAAARRL